MLGFCCFEGFSLVAVSGGYSVAVPGLLIAMASLVSGHGLWGMQASAVAAPGSGALAQHLWHTGLVALKHVGPSQPRDQTCVSCTDRQIVYH